MAEVAQETKLDQQFLEDLENIFKKSFNAKIYPNQDGKVMQAKANVNEELHNTQLIHLLSLAGRHNLKIKIARSGAGMRVDFYSL